MRRPKGDDRQKVGNEQGEANSRERASLRVRTRSGDRTMLSPEQLPQANCLFPLCPQPQCLLLRVGETLQQLLV